MDQRPQLLVGQVHRLPPAGSSCRPGRGPLLREALPATNRHSSDASRRARLRIRRTRRLGLRFPAARLRGICARPSGRRSAAGRLAARVAEESTSLRVLLAEDHAVVREGTRELLERVAGPRRSWVRLPTAPRSCEMAASPAPGRRAHGPGPAGHQRHRGDAPDPRGSGPDGSRVLVLSAYDDEDYVVAATRGGRQRLPPEVGPREPRSSPPSARWPAGSSSSTRPSRGTSSGAAARPGPREELATRELDVAAARRRRAAGRETSPTTSAVSGRTVEATFTNVFNKLGGRDAARRRSSTPPRTAGSASTARPRHRWTADDAAPGGSGRGGRLPGTRPPAADPPPRVLDGPGARLRHRRGAHASSRPWCASQFPARSTSSRRRCSSSRSSTPPSASAPADRSPRPSGASPSRSPTSSSCTAASTAWASSGSSGILLAIAAFVGVRVDRERLARAADRGARASARRLRGALPRPVRRRRRRRARDRR